ncbi:MAG TPA: sigma-70 family RNA polymerase sigma factor, partial [Kofleriaceae bacterium]|nr:sigma-70 family RNA polymerase sigma factor [Kofleriaceae bacterium]
MSLREAVRAEATERTWSQGVTLAREGRVAGVGRNGREVELEVRVPGKPTPFEVVVDNTERSSPDHARVRTALEGLSGDQKRVVELAYFEGLSCSEIAERIAIPIGTVKSRLAAGLQKLRDTL